MKWKPILVAVATASILGGAENMARKPPVQGYATQRVTEKLDRGIVAVLDHRIVMRRYGRVFVYHNGAQSFYGARGFRGVVRV